MNKLSAVSYQLSAELEIRAVHPDWRRSLFWKLKVFWVYQADR